MRNWSLLCADSSQTHDLGRILGLIASEMKEAGLVAVALVGELGVGKTCFAQGVGEGAQVHDEVTSPTFALMNEYRGDVPVLHCDAYRLEEWEIDGVGLEECIENWTGICLVEWADRFSWVMPKEALWITLSLEGQGRRVSIRAAGARHEQLLERWHQAWKARVRESQ